jgi:hypothetical protein
MATLQQPAMNSGKKSSLENERGSQVEGGSLALSSTCANKLLGTPLANANVSVCFKVAASSRTAGLSHRRSGTGMCRRV